MISHICLRSLLHGQTTAQDSALESHQNVSLVDRDHLFQAMWESALALDPSSRGIRGLSSVTLSIPVVVVAGVRAQ